MPVLCSNEVWQCTSLRQQSLRECLAKYRVYTMEVTLEAGFYISKQDDYSKQDMQSSLCANPKINPHP